MTFPPPSPGMRWVAIDFDGVIANPVWPDPGIGEPIVEGMAMVAHYADQGYRVAIHTSRPWSDAEKIERWCEEHALPVDQIICGKVLAGVYVDDRAYRPSWAPPLGDRPEVLIGITGYARAGKDTVASFLPGIERLALADTLKDIARTIGWSGSKENEPPCESCGMHRGRGLLQQLGTEGVRGHLGDDAWTRAAERRFTSDSRLAISDVRFPDEASWVRRWGGVIWRVRRPGTRSDGHASEAGVDQITPDVEIHNDGTLEELRALVRELARSGFSPVEDPPLEVRATRWTELAQSRDLEAETA